MNNDQQAKQCTKCLVFKPLVEFCKQKTGKYGRTSQCKDCNRERNRKWAEANPEKVREYNRKYREANPEKAREYNRKYREANPEKAREQSRKWAAANPEKVREKDRKRHARNRQTNIFIATMKMKSSDVMAEIEAELHKLEQKQNKENK